MKRINVLITVWATSRGGAEMFILRVIQKLSNGPFNFVLFSSRKQPGDLHDDFAKVCKNIYYANTNRFIHPIKYIRFLKDIIRNEKIDVIHANNDALMVYALLARPKYVKFIAHAHSTQYRISGNPLISKLFTKRVLKYISKYSDIRLACGNDAGRALYGNDNFIVVPNGIDVEKFKYSESIRKKIREENGVEENEILILNIGRTDKPKNQLFLINVFNIYHHNHPDSKLLIIGEGPERLNLEKKIVDLNLNDAVLLLNNQKYIADYYSAADVFVMTSLYEGMPTVLIEAQANGVPVAASSSISEEARFNENFEFVKLDSTYDEWADIIKKMGTKRIIPNKRLDDYSIEKTVSAIEKCYSGGRTC